VICVAGREGVGGQPSLLVWLAWGGGGGRGGGSYWLVVAGRGARIP